MTKSHLSASHRQENHPAWLVDTCPTSHVFSLLSPPAPKSRRLLVHGNGVAKSMYTHTHVHQRTPRTHGHTDIYLLSPWSPGGTCPERRRFPVRPQREAQTRQSLPPTRAGLRGRPARADVRLSSGSATVHTPPVPSTRAKPPIFLLSLECTSRSHPPSGPPPPGSLSRLESFSLPGTLCPSPSPAPPAHDPAVTRLPGFAPACLTAQEALPPPLVSPVPSHPEPGTSNTVGI